MKNYECNHEYISLDQLYRICKISKRSALYLIQHGTTNSLAAYDEVIIPVSPQLWSATGLTDLLQTIFKVKRKINPRITVAGILLTILRHEKIFQRRGRRPRRPAYKTSAK